MTAPSCPAQVAMVERRLRELAGKGAFDLPRPGAGTTRARFDALVRFGAEDLSVGRLAEAHTDALAIRAEAGLDADPRRLLGVWASGGPHNRVVARPARRGWRLEGRRTYCSGAAILDAALVTVDTPDGAELLLSVDLRDPGLSIDPTTWRTPALAASATATVTFHDVSVDADDAVGGPGFYVDRPGFWAGSVGVAAVWAGGSRPLVETMRSRVGDDAHAMAHLGAAEVASWSMTAALIVAADEIDADPLDEAGAGVTRALTVRHLVERACHEIIDRSARGLGPGPLVDDPDHAQRVADLQLYVRQGHAERDLEAIGRAAAVRS